ncbi:hypothetical protein K458DRAFT_165525 [Lentithecium fluviatile CBS 122367]|uniref:Uncharacterized protein n=1 Tax=Lentithecium fluviatile CBS 122367 TaxID=1168545 RepID=A0A6G1IFV8_9PLEO|nr:hypothetical protein K458DRAFT_165525 [Lentithecium fluviatile CBS 122367]
MLSALLLLLLSLSNRSAVTHIRLAYAQNKEPADHVSITSANSIVPVEQTSYRPLKAIRLPLQLTNTNLPILRRPPNSSNLKLKQQPHTPHTALMHTLYIRRSMPCYATLLAQGKKRGGKTTKQKNQGQEQGVTAPTIHVSDKHHTHNFRTRSHSLHSPSNPSHQLSTTKPPQPPFL